MKKPALFIDRDGVINNMVLQNNGLFDSPQNVKQIRLVNGIVKVLNWLNKNHIPVIEISNQPGVALGKMSWQTLEAIEEKIQSLLRKQNVVIDKTYRCFHHPKSKIYELKIDCDCRKPKSGMLIQAALELNLDLSRCIFLGDTISDMRAGEKVKCKTILFFHNNDLIEKVKAKQFYKADYKIHSLKEVISILNQLFK